MPSSPSRSGTATVIGGGPAGLTAAEVLASAGMTVTVYEHMASVGRKLLLAGRGGLNLTHSEPLDQLLARFGPSAERLDAAVRGFTPNELRAWCAALGEPTFVGSSGRVFPRSFRATPLLRAWLARLSVAGVTFEVRTRWLGWAADPGSPKPFRTLSFRGPDDATRVVTSDVVVFALGGASWPRVGSDGGWVEKFRRAGIAVNDLRPANCGVLVEWSSATRDRYLGVPVKNIAVTIGGVAIRGDAMVTSTGLEGGPVYAHTAAIRDSIDRSGRCTIEIDLQPDLTLGDVIDRLSQRRQKDSLTTTLRRTLGLSPAAIAMMREVTKNKLPPGTEELGALVKAVPLVVEATMSIDRAISSAGGIVLDEIDSAFMLRRMPGVFVAGEMLDWEAPTGGYLLQASFSTAVAAARGAIEWLEQQ